MSTIQPLLEPLSQGKNLSYDDVYTAFAALLAGKENPLLIAALLMGLHAKGESVPELTAACAAMQDAMITLPDHRDAIDIVGTGGDGQQTLNISTATALVVAGSGVKVAKHGNRAASSLSGASDVLSALGVEIKVHHDTIHRAITETGIAFLWAPLFHPGMKHVVPVRQTLKIQTIFNFLGPLCNPAQVKRLLLGVARSDIVRPMVEALRQRGCNTVWGVHGADGLDELSITGENQVVALQDQTLRAFSSHPEDAGLPVHPLKAIRGGTPKDNARALRTLLAGQPSAYRDMVLYNAAAALVVVEKAANLPEGVAMARDSIDSGAAMHSLESLIRITTS
ncbi:MAG: anthranilate phosphoribosyltransferase [Alphaproteobacteria bacterium]|nr:anthranilate phosphoribosyltransferase [Alphaproteobacteria bacterium]